MNLSPCHRCIRVVERKALSDLEDSLRDGRYVEQKARMARTGFNLVYLIEDDESGYDAGDCRERLIAEGLTLVETRNAKASCRFLCQLHGGLAGAGQGRFETALAFDEFQRAFAKWRTPSVGDVLVRMLAGLPGRLVRDKAAALGARFGTPGALQAFVAGGGPDEARRRLAALPGGPQERVGEAYAASVVRAFGGA